MTSHYKDYLIDIEYFTNMTIMMIDISSVKQTENDDDDEEWW